MQGSSKRKLKRVSKCTVEICGAISPQCGAIHEHRKAIGVEGVGAARACEAMK